MRLGVPCGSPFLHRSHLGPPAAGHRSRTYCSAGAVSGRAPGCRQGTRADCGADGESSEPSGRGFRPSQGSQASPRPPAPRALAYASAISWRCRRHAMASNVTAAPCSVVSSHRILRNCGRGFIGSRQPRRADHLDGAASSVHASRGELLTLTARFSFIVPTSVLPFRPALLAELRGYRLGRTAGVVEKNLGKKNPAGVPAGFRRSLRGQPQGRAPCLPNPGPRACPAAEGSATRTRDGGRPPQAR